MPEWNTLENFISSRGYFTIYSPNYDDELEDQVTWFDCSGPKPGRISYLDSLADCFENSLANVMDNGDEDEYDLIGLNSNSFTSDGNHHNIFLEWDRSMHMPDMEALRSLGGTIVETGNGLHFLKEANMQWEELKKLMEIWQCCNGFSHYSDRRRHACLRVCPKGDNRLHIVEKEESFLFDVYEQIVKKLEEVHNGVVG